MLRHACCPSWQCLISDKPLVPCRASGGPADKLGAALARLPTSATAQLAAQARLAAANTAEKSGECAQEPLGASEVRC